MSENPFAWLDYAEWVADVENEVATIRFREVDKPVERHLEHHVSLAIALESLRWNDSVRVIVLAGRDDGSGQQDLGPKQAPPSGETMPRRAPGVPVRPAGLAGYENLMGSIGGPQHVAGPWSLSQGVERTFQALALLEKPIIAKWTGNVGGFGGNALFGCDIIIAREDVTYTDSHMKELPGISAGDGALAVLPLYLTPTKVKELLLLGETWTATQLADLGVVNYALPAEQVDAKVDEFVEAFLRRPPTALARTKRALNKQFVQQFNQVLDGGLLAELLDIWQRPAMLAAGVERSLQPDAAYYTENWAKFGQAAATEPAVTNE